MNHPQTIARIKTIFVPRLCLSDHSFLTLNNKKILPNIPRHAKKDAIIVCTFIFPHSYLAGQLLFVKALSRPPPATPPTNEETILSDSFAVEPNGLPITLNGT